MACYPAFHYRLNIVRKSLTHENEIEYIKHPLRDFVTRTPTPYFTVGSSPDADFICEDLLPIHVQFSFQNDSLIVLPKGEVEISLEHQQKVLSAGELIRAPFARKKLLDVGTLLEWNLRIPPHIAIEGTMEVEESAPLEVIKALSRLHGPLENLQQGDSCFLFTTSAKRVVKVLRSNLPFAQQIFLESAGTIEEIPSNLFLKIEEVRESPVCHVKREYFAGETLKNYMAKKGRIGYREAFSIVSALASELLKLHELPYTCAILCPENILRGCDGQLKVTGFRTLLPSDVMVLEEGSYLAPEYLKNQETASPACDVFSLGVILYRLLTGKLPFPDLNEYRRIIAAKDFIGRYALQRSSPQITPQLSELLEAMLSIAPQGRPSCEETVSWLKEISDFEVWSHATTMPDAPEEGARYCLQVVSAAQEQEVKMFPLGEKTSITIGREGDIEIKGDFRISRQHVRLTIENGVCVLKDLGGRNGTWVEGERISERQIESGTCFTIGYTVLCFWDYQQIREYQKSLLTVKPSAEEASPTKEPPALAAAMEGAMAGEIEAMAQGEIAAESPEATPEQEIPEEKLKGQIQETPGTGRLESKALKKIYSTIGMAMQTPSPKTRQRRGQPICGEKGEKDVKMSSVYKKAAAGMAVVLTLFLSLFFGSLVSRPGETPASPAAEGALIPSPQPGETHHPSFEGGSAFVQTILQKLFVTEVPSQLYLNSLLKQIHLQGASHGAFEGDICNLTGRLYYYKIYLDRHEDLFDKSWKDAWSHEVTANFQKARDAYRKQDHETGFRLMIMPWMPEREWHPGERFILYRSLKEAEKDMDNWLLRLESPGY